MFSLSGDIGFHFGGGRMEIRVVMVASSFWGGGGGCLWEKMGRYFGVVGSSGLKSLSGEEGGDSGGGEELKVDVEERSWEGEGEHLCEHLCEGGCLGLKMIISKIVFILSYKPPSIFC